MSSQMISVDSFSMLLRQISGDFKHYEDLFALIGICVVGKVTISLLLTLTKGVKTHIFSKLRHPNLLQKYGNWAIVTGATDGIGKAYAKELAKRGLNIVLISRNIAKLNKVASEIREEYAVETKIIQADFGQGIKAYPAIESELESLNVGILVNNVGTITSHACYVNEMSEDAIWDHVNVNVAAVTVMTRMLLPRMISQNRGAIVNLSSLAALNPVPFMAVYSATKAYIDFFSSAVTYECRLQGATGVTVQTLIPSTVRTRMLFSEKQHINLATPDPETYARNAIATLGKASRTTGYWFHGIEAWLFSSMPTWMWMFAASFTYGSFRLEYLQKQAKEKLPEDNILPGSTSEIQQGGLHKRL